MGGGGGKGGGGKEGCLKDENYLRQTKDIHTAYESKANHRHVEIVRET